MTDKIKKELNKITIPKELSERSKMGVYQAKKEIKNGKKRFSTKVIGMSALLLASVGTFILFTNDSFNHMIRGEQVAMEGDSVTLPAIQLPEDTSNADMIGLIVYNGKIYTQTNTEIDAEDAKMLIGEKLGTTKSSIDEWSSQDAYDEELASTIGVTDVYSVKGYDKDFRIMTYQEVNGEQYAEFFENLNGITIKNGEDVFGQLKIEDNVVSAEYRVFSDWDNSIDNFYPVKEREVLNSFLNELNRAKPILPTTPFIDDRNDENFREMVIHLEDGTRVKLILLKDGTISYGFMDVDFEIDQDVFLQLWNQLE